MPIAPAVGYMRGSRSTYAAPGTIGPAQTSRGTSSTRPAAMYPFTMAPSVSVTDNHIDDGHCTETTKAGNPCKGKKVQGTDYCFSHVRNHRGTEPTAD